MKKYKLINRKTNEEHLCEKVTVDGFDYYVNNEKPTINNWVIEYQKGDDLGSLFFIKNEYVLASDIQKLVIATNNPNIDVPKVVDEVEIECENLTYKDYKHLCVRGYNKAKETYKFTEENMIEFAWFMYENLGQFSFDRIAHFDGEYFKMWKEQRIETIYFE